RLVPHGLRGRLLLARRFHGHLPRLQENLQACRRNLEAAGRSGCRTRREGGRTDQGTDQTAHHGPRTRIRRSHLLLDVVPPERSYAHVVRTRLYGQLGRRAHPNRLQPAHDDLHRHRHVQSVQHLPVHHEKGEIHIGRRVRADDCTVYHPLHEPRSEERRVGYVFRSWWGWLYD